MPKSAGPRIVRSGSSGEQISADLARRAAGANRHRRMSRIRRRVALDVMKHRTMVFSGFEQYRAVLAALALLGTGGCGGIADTELFGESNAALVEHIGEACDLDGIGANETVIEDEDPSCTPGYCVGQGGQPWTDEENDRGICTCRCAGPEGTGPLCDCSDGFECRELIKDFGGLGGLHLVGSYCVPRD